MGNIIYLETAINHRKRLEDAAVDFAVGNDMRLLQQVLDYLTPLVGYDEACGFLERNKCKILFGSQWTN